MILLESGEKFSCRLTGKWRAACFNLISVPFGPGCRFWISSQLVRYLNTPSMSPMTSSILSESSPARLRGSKRNGVTLYLFGLKDLSFKSLKVMLARTVTPAVVGNAKKAICDYFRRLLLSVFLFEGTISSPACPEQSTTMERNNANCRGDRQSANVDR